MPVAGASVRDRTAEFSQLVERLKKQPVRAREPSLPPPFLPCDLPPSLPLSHVPLSVRVALRAQADS